MTYDEECNVNNDRHRQQMKVLSALEIEMIRVRDAILQAQDKNGQRQKFLKWLCTIDPSKNYNDARASHALSTGDWLVKGSSTFKKWENAPNSLLWLHRQGMLSLVLDYQELMSFCSWIGQVIPEV
jgi:hypothetical protein